MKNRVSLVLISLLLIHITLNAQKTGMRDPGRVVNITALQAGSDHFRNGNPGLEANFALFADLARKAAKSDPKPDIICFPEYTITGWSYPPEKVINSIAEEIPGNGYWYRKWVALARETGTPLLAWLVESSEGKLYNTSFLLDSKGDFVGKYRKVQANLGEQTWWGWSQGEQFSIIEFDGVRYGISICADMWYPETVRCEELLGADVILHVSIADDMGHLIPARAYDSDLPIVVSAFQGGAYAVDNQGKSLGKLPSQKAAFITFPVHPFTPHLGKKYGGVWDTKKGSQNVRNTGAYSILTDPATRPLWTDIFMDNDGNAQMKDQLLKRFNGRWDANDPSDLAKAPVNAGSFEKWKCIELEFTGPSSAAKGNPDPFLTDADVTFTGPGGQQSTIPAFYDGDGKENINGSVWKVRFSADETGKWSYMMESKNRILDGYNGTFTVVPVKTDSHDFYRWGRLEATKSGRYLKFREGPYWMKAGCDDPENFLGNLTSYNTNEKRKAAVDYLSSKGVNSLYIMTNNIDGDGKDVWPWLGDTQKEAKTNGTGEVRFNIEKLEQWKEIFDYMQEKGMVVYIVLEDDSAWKGYDHERYYRELIARFGYLPGLIFNLNEEYNENYSKEEGLGLMALLKKTDPYDHPCGIHNINVPDDDYIKASQIDFTSIQTGTAGKKEAPGPNEYHDLITSWIKRADELSSPLMIGVDEGRPEQDRKVWWSTYLSGGVWEAHVLDPYDRPMNAWDTVWTQLGGTRKFMESIPFHEMNPDQSVVKSGKAFCLNHESSVIALYLPDGGTVTLDLPEGCKYRVSWWNPVNGIDGEFQNETVIKGGIRKIVPPGKGDWAVKLTGN